MCTSSELKFDFLKDKYCMTTSLQTQTELNEKCRRTNFTVTTCALKALRTDLLILFSLVYHDMIDLLLRAQSVNEYLIKKNLLALISIFAIHRSLSSLPVLNLLLQSRVYWLIGMFCNLFNKHCSVTLSLIIHLQRRLLYSIT